MELTTQRVAATVGLLAVVAIGAIWLVPRLQARRWRAMGLEAKVVAELENSARGTLVQAFGAIALILTFVATWVQIDNTRDESVRSRELIETQQQSERFTAALAQLGSDKLEVRVGGIYTLGQAAGDSEERQRTVAALLMAYLKQRHPVNPDDRRLGMVDGRNRTALSLPVPIACERTIAYPRADTQAAITVLVDLPRRTRGTFDLAGVDLIGVRSPGGDFYGVDLSDASLADADLAGSNFENARLVGTDLRETCFRGAHFPGATVGRAQTLGSDFRGVDLTEFKTAYGNFDTGIARPFYGAMTDDCSDVPKDSGLASLCGRSP